MACREIQLRGSTLAYSSLSNTSWVFIPITGVVSLSGVNDFRMQVELISAEGITVRRSYRKGNEEVAWQAPQTMGSELTANGWDYDTTYTSAPVSYRMIQFGIEVRNTSGSLANAGQVNVIVEARVQ